MEVKSPEGTSPEEKGTTPYEQGVQDTLQAAARVERPEATSPTAGALKALEAAEALRTQTSPAIWFDSWGNDLRDNDLNGDIDDKLESVLPNGKPIPDGSHYGQTYKARVCQSDPNLTVASCPAGQTKIIDVTYKVCIDIAIESYLAARVPISTKRWIPDFFSELKHMRGWRVWDHGKQPKTLLDGDIVAASNPRHQHAGIVSTGRIWDSVINLPGPTAARHYQLYRPSGLNDMRSVPRVLFESFLQIDYIARRIR